MTSQTPQAPDDSGSSQTAGYPPEGTPGSESSPAGPTSETERGGAFARTAPGQAPPSDTNQAKSEDIPPSEGYAAGGRPPGVNATISSADPQGPGAIPAAPSADTPMTTPTASSAGDAQGVSVASPEASRGTSEDVGLAQGVRAGAEADLPDEGEDARRQGPLPFSPHEGRAGGREPGQGAIVGRTNAPDGEVGPA